MKAIPLCSLLCAPDLIDNTIHIRGVIIICGTFLKSLLHDLVITDKV